MSDWVFPIMVALALIVVFLLASATRPVYSDTATWAANAIVALTALFVVGIGFYAALMYFK